MWYGKMVMLLFESILHQHTHTHTVKLDTRQLRTCRADMTQFHPGRLTGTQIFHKTPSSCGVRFGTLEIILLLHFSAGIVATAFLLWDKWGRGGGGNEIPQKCYTHILGVSHPAGECVLALTTPTKRGRDTCCLGYWAACWKNSPTVLQERNSNPLAPFPSHMEHEGTCARKSVIIERFSQGSAPSVRSRTVGVRRRVLL